MSVADLFLVGVWLSGFVVYMQPVHKIENDKASIAILQHLLSEHRTQAIRIVVISGGVAFAATLIIRSSNYYLVF